MGTIRKAKNGDIVLYTRGDSRNIFYRIRMPDGSGWRRFNSKSPSDNVAMTKALDEYTELKIKVRYNLSLTPKSFSAAAEMYIKELEAEVALGERNPRDIELDVPRIRRYFMPFFKGKEIDTISNQNIAEYKKWRTSYWVSGPGSKEKFITYQRKGKTIKRPVPEGNTPSLNTLTREDVFLRGIFNLAVQKGYMKEIQLPTIKTKKPKKRDMKDGRRPYFTYVEYRKLMRFMNDWVKMGRNRERRELLRDYIRFLVNTGIRPGTETDNLKWGHITRFKTAAGFYRLKLAVLISKTAPRTVIAKTGAARALASIKIRYIKRNGKGWPPNKPSNDDYLFILSDGTPVKNNYFAARFDQLLRDAGLTYDKFGDKRTLYSCRHSYATWQLEEGRVDKYTLLEVMGTSDAMLKRHYSHVDVTNAADRLT